jgi:lysine-N-methylase
MKNKANTDSRKQQITGIKADSVDGFQCTMGNCEDNCCRNTTWKINVDKQTYEKYKTLEDVKLREHIISCIEEQGDQLVFKEFDHGHCPLLTASGLCTIHRDLGAEFLCKTCTTYPRVWNAFNGQPEFWLSLSCPDVIRWVLYRKKRINYTKNPVLVDVLPPPGMPNDENKSRVRDMLIKISQRNKFSLKEKFIYMGLFMRSLTKSTDVGAVIDMYKLNMKKPDFMTQLLGGLETMSQDYRIMIFGNLSSAVAGSVQPPRKIPSGIKNEKYYHQIQKLHNDARHNIMPQYLIEAFDKIIVPYVNENPHVFENYLVYSLVSTRFISETDDYAKAFAGFAGEFITMLVFTAGLFKQNETLTHDEMIVGMYLFHRTVSHNPKLRTHLASAFSDNLLNMLLGALGGIK